MSGFGWVASKPDTPLHPAGVVVEVRVAATRGAPQHQSLIIRVILGEESVKGERLAWPIGEDPGYPISQAIRVTGATTAPAITRGLAFIVEWHEVTNLGIENTVVRHPKRGKERQFPNQHDVLEGVGPGWLTGSDITAQDSIGVQRDGRDRDVHLVVCVGPPAISTHDHTIRDVARLEADDVRGIHRQCAIRVGSRPQDIVATTADNQHVCSRRVGVNATISFANKPLMPAVFPAWISVRICWFRLTWRFSSSARDAVSTT